MNAPRIVVAGYLTDPARAFLKKNGAIIEKHKGLFFITLPENAVVGREGGAARQHSIIFLDEAGEQIDHLCLIVYLKINAASTRVDLFFDEASGLDEESGPALSIDESSLE